MAAQPESRRCQLTIDDSTVNSAGSITVTSTAGDSSKEQIYAEAFGAAAIGRASVMAVVLFVILVGITLVQHLYFRKRVTYDLT